MLNQLFIALLMNAVGNINVESETQSVSVASTPIDLPVGVVWLSLCEVCGEAQQVLRTQARQLRDGLNGSV